MEAHVKSKHATFKIDAETPKDLFKAIAGLQETFSESSCGLCGCQDIILVVRPNKGGDEFYEYQCKGKVDLGGKTVPCDAYLAMSSAKKRPGQLFPNRKLEENGKPADRRNPKNGKFGPHRGWTRYRGEYTNSDDE